MLYFDELSNGLNLLYDKSYWIIKMATLNFATCKIDVNYFIVLSLCFILISLFTHDCWRDQNMMQNTIYKCNSFAYIDYLKYNALPMDDGVFPIV